MEMMKPRDYEKRKLKIDSPEALNLLESINATNFNKDFRNHYWRVENIYLVNNDRLTQRHENYRKELLTAERTEESLKDVLLFSVESEKSCTEICEDGYKVGARIKNVLGHTRCGVHLASHYDILTRYLIYQDYTSPTYVMVFKAYLGKRNPVYPLLYKHDNIIQPNSDYDCHISSRSVQNDMHICEALNCSYVYLYEYDYISSNPVKYPRQILPYAIIQLMKKKIPLINESPFLAVAPKDVSHTWEVTGETRRGFRFILSKSGLKPVHKGIRKDSKCHQLDSILKEQIQEMRSKSSRKDSPKSPPALTKIDPVEDIVIPEHSDEPPSLTKVCKTTQNSAQQHAIFSPKTEDIKQHYRFPLMHLFPQLSQKPLVRLNRVDEKGFVTTEKVQSYVEGLNGKCDIPFLDKRETNILNSEGCVQDVSNLKHYKCANGQKKGRGNRKYKTNLHLKFKRSKAKVEFGKRSRTLNVIVKSNNKRRWNIHSIHKLKRISQLRRFRSLTRYRKSGFKHTDKCQKTNNCSDQNIEEYIVAKDGSDNFKNNNSTIKLRLTRKCSMNSDTSDDSFRPLKLSEVDAIVHNLHTTGSNETLQHSINTDDVNSLEQCDEMQANIVLKSKEGITSKKALLQTKDTLHEEVKCKPDSESDKVEESTGKTSKPSDQVENHPCSKDKRDTKFDKSTATTCTPSDKVENYPCSKDNRDAKFDKSTATTCTPSDKVENNPCSKDKRDAKFNKSTKTTCSPSDKVEINPCSKDKRDAKFDDLTGTTCTPSDKVENYLCSKDKRVAKFDKSTATTCTPSDKVENHPCSKDKRVAKIDESTATTCTPSDKVENYLCGKDKRDAKIDKSTGATCTPSDKVENYLCRKVKLDKRIDKGLLKTSTNAKDSFSAHKDHTLVLNDVSCKSNTKILPVNGDKINSFDGLKSKKGLIDSFDIQKDVPTKFKGLDEKGKVKHRHSGEAPVPEIVGRQNNHDKGKMASKNVPQSHSLPRSSEFKEDGQKNELSENQTLTRALPLCKSKINDRDPRLKHHCSSLPLVTTVDKAIQKSADSIDSKLELSKENTGCKRANLKVDALTATKLRMFLSTTAAAALRKKKESGFQKTSEKALAREPDSRSSCALVNCVTKHIKTENSISIVKQSPNSTTETSTSCSIVPNSCSRKKIFKPPDVEDNDSQETVIGGVSSPPNPLYFNHSEFTAINDAHEMTEVCPRTECPIVVKTEPFEGNSPNTCVSRTEIGQANVETKQSEILKDGHGATLLNVDLNSVKIEPQWEDTDSTAFTVPSKSAESLTNSSLATSFNEPATSPDLKQTTPYDKSTIVDALKELSSVLKYLTKDSTKKDAATVAEKMCRTLSTISSNRVKTTPPPEPGSQDRISIDREDIQIKQEPLDTFENDIGMLSQKAHKSANVYQPNKVSSQTVVKNEIIVCNPKQLSDDILSDERTSVGDKPVKTTVITEKSNHSINYYARKNKPNEIWCKLVSQDEPTDEELREHSNELANVLDTNMSENIVSHETFGTPYLGRLLSSKKRLLLRKEESFIPRPCHEDVSIEPEPSKTMTSKPKVSPFTLKSGVLNKGLKFNSLRRRTSSTPLTVKKFPSIIVFPTIDSNAVEIKKNDTDSETVKLEKDDFIKQPGSIIDDMKHSHTNGSACSKDEPLVEPISTSENANQVKPNNHVDDAQIVIAKQTSISENTKESEKTPQVNACENAYQNQPDDFKENVKTPLEKQTNICETASKIKSEDSEESFKPTTSMETFVFENDESNEKVNTSSIDKSKMKDQRKSHDDMKTNKKVPDIIPFHTVLRLKKQQYLRYKRGESNSKFIDYKNLYSRMTRKYAPYSKRKEFVMRTYRAKHLEDSIHEDRKTSKNTDSAIETQVANFLTDCKNTAKILEAKRNSHDKSIDREGKTNAKHEERYHDRSRSKSSHRSLDRSSEKKYENSYGYIKNRRKESDFYFPTKRFFFNPKRPFYKPFVYNKFHFHRKWDTNTYNARSTFTKSGTGYFSWKRRYQPNTYRKYNKEQQIVTRSGKVLPKSECIEWCKFTKRENIKIQIEQAIEEYKKTFDSNKHDEVGEEKVASYLQLLSAKLGKIKSHDDDSSLPEEEGFVSSTKPRKTLLEDGPCDKFPYRKAKLLVDKHERSLSLSRKVSNRRPSTSKLSKSLVGEDQRLSHRHGREISVLLKEHLEKHCDQISKQIKKEITDEIEDFHEGKGEKGGFYVASKKSHRHQEVKNHKEFKMSSRDYDDKMDRRESSKSSDRSGATNEFEKKRRYKDRSTSEERERSQNGYRHYTKEFYDKPYHHPKFSSTYTRGRPFNRHTYMWNKHNEGKFTSPFKFNDRYGFRGRGFRRNFENFRPTERYIPKGFFLSKYKHKFDWKQNKFDWKHNKFDPYRYKDTHGSSEREKRYSSPSYKKEYSKEHGFVERKYSSSKPFRRKENDDCKDRSSFYKSKGYHDSYKRKSDSRSDSHRSRRSSSKDRRKTTSRDRARSSSSRSRKNSIRKSIDKDTRRDNSPKPIPTICSRRS